jgi:hypothetical protein
MQNCSRSGGGRRLDRFAYSRHTKLVD